MDFIAKVSEKLGVKFNFADNQRLKESGFALEGVTVNGFVNKDGITINVNSAKALNSVVGHEITHILEGTDLYESLAMTITEYAKKKGEYESRMKQIRDLYEGKEGYTGEDAEAKLEAELVADLVGDYIFTDKQFVEKLFTENRNLFQRIYDEIKYLCKLVTAGSKEARLLEKSKKMFTEVVNEAKQEGVKNPTGEGEVKYDLSKNAKAEVHKLLYDTKYRDDVQLRDVTPPIMLGHNGVSNLPMAMKASHIRENVFTEAEARKLGLKVNDDTHYHGLGEDLFLQVIDNLDKVKEAYRGTKHASDPTRREDYFLLISELTDAKGNIINVPVYINRHAQVNRVFVDANKISTVYGKEELRDYIATQVKNKNLVRIKRKSTESSERAAHMAAGYRSDASNNSIRNPEENVNKNSLSLPGQAENTSGGWNVRGRDVSLPMPEGFQESPVAGTETNQAKPVNLPGLEKSQPQSQGKARSGVLPMPKQTPKDQQTAAREALQEALFGKQQTGTETRPAQQTTQQETADLDAEYRRQMFAYSASNTNTVRGVPKAPLCKGSCHANSVTEGLCIAKAFRTAALPVVFYV